MSVTLKTNQVKLKIQNGNYQAPVVIADQTTADHVAEVNTAITTTGNQQVSAIQTKGDEVLDSIPEDYTDLVEDVDELKSALDLFDWEINSQMIDKDNLNVINGYISGNEIIGGAMYRTIYIPIDNDTDYTLTNNSGAVRFNAATSVALPAIGSVTWLSVWTNPNANGIQTFHSGNANYISIYYYNGNAETQTEDQILSLIKLEKGSVSTATTDGYEYGSKTAVVINESNLSSSLQQKINHVSNGRYGVRWNKSDADDLGERCFDAVGLNATIGVGSTNGSSDFDSIYPWSEIKRCNIKTNANGASVVTFEGETGFATDGTNGDVFVRIPKFYVEKYEEDGYEYRVISGTGISPHKVFIENGVELDEIFIGVYEGYSNGTVLKSISGVIPTCNLAPTAFLALAKANGSNYSLYDMRCVDAVWTLMAVEFGCRNTNQILGYGIADYYQPTNFAPGKCIEAATGTNSIKTAKWEPWRKEFMPVGSNVTICGNQSQEDIITQAKLLSITDADDNSYTVFTFDGDPIDVDTDCFIGSAACDTDFADTCATPLTWHTGRAIFVSGSTTRNPVRYRWIENPVGNLWHYLPDTLFVSLQMYVCGDMLSYDVSQITNAYKPVGSLLTEQSSNGNKSDVANANYWITELLNDTFAKGSCFGKAFDTSLISTKAFGGYYYLNNVSAPLLIANGGGFDHLYRCNMLTHRAWITSTQKWYLYGARLMYKHLV